MSAGFAIKCLAVTILAALVAWLPMAILLTIGIDANLATPLAGRLLVLPILGCTLVGLPLAFIIVRRTSELSLAKLLIFANAAGTLLALACAIPGGGFAAFFYGLPSLLAANAFAIFGWILIAKPSQKTANA